VRGVAATFSLNALNSLRMSFISSSIDKSTLVTPVLVPLTLLSLSRLVLTFVDFFFGEFNDSRGAVLPNTLGLYDQNLVDSPLAGARLSSLSLGLITYETAVVS